MKTIKLTDDQFETLFHFVDERFYHKPVAPKVQP